MTTPQIDLEALTPEQFFSMTPEEIFSYVAPLHTDQICKLTEKVGDEWVAANYSTTGHKLFTKEQWIAAYQRAEALNDRYRVLRDLYFIKDYNLEPLWIKGWIGHSRSFCEKCKEDRADIMRACRGLKQEGELKGSEWIELIVEELDKKESDSDGYRL